MTNEQILKKAKQLTSDKKKILDIFVAVKLDGYKKIRKGKKNNFWGTVGFITPENSDEIYGEKNNGEYSTKNCEISSYSECIFFKHDFAKAFWGKEQKYYDKFFNGCPPDEIRGMLDWQYHLQRMVLEKEPLKYIEKFL